MGRVPLRISALAFLIFVVNVTLGAFAGRPLLGDVVEMLTLLIAVAFFVAGILVAEATEKAKKTTK